MKRLLIYFGLMLAGAVMLGACMWGLALCSDRLGTVGYMKALQIAQSLFVFILPALLAAMIYGKTPTPPSLPKYRGLIIRRGLEWLHLSNLQTLKLTVGTCALVFVMMIVAAPGINLLAWLNETMSLPTWLTPIESWMRSMEDAAGDATEMMVRADTPGVMLFNLFLMAFLPALGEEMTFRGIVQGLLGLRRNVHTAVWVTAIIFSAIHLQFYGFVPRMLLGAMLGYLLVWSGSLWLPILAHFTNNAIAVVTYYIADHYMGDTEALDAFGTADTWYIGALSLVLTLTLLTVIYRRLHACIDRECIDW